MAVIGNAPFQGLVSGGNIIDASIEGVDLSTSAIAARLGYTPVDPGAAAIIGGTINGTTIGATTAATGAFTNLSASGTLGVTGVATLATGAVLNTPASITLTNATGLPLTTGTTGTLAVAKGGTNLTSFTSGGVVYASSTSALATGSGLTFNGADLTVANGDLTIGTNGKKLFVNYIANNSGTDLYIGSGNTIFSTAGSEAMRLTSTSLYTATGISVGIGTSNPLSKLNVKGTQGNWRIDPDSVSAEIQLLTTTVTNDGFRNYRIRSNETIFDTAGAERGRFNSEGLSVIGSLSVGPSSGAGGIAVGSAAGRAQYQYVNFGGGVGGTDYAWQIGRSPSGGVGPADGFYIYDLKASATRLSINGSGNVGIGTADPQNRLHVEGADAIIRLRDTNGGVCFWGSDSVGTFWRSFTYDTFRWLRASGTESMRLNSSGDLLVGVTTNHTGAKLYVENAINVNYSGEIAMRYNVSGQSTSYWKGMTGTTPGAGSSARGLHFFNYDNDSDDGINFWTGRPGSATRLMQINSTGQINFRNSSAFNVAGIKASGFGYSQGSYGALVLGAAVGGGSTTVCINVDPSGNSNGSFTGNGGEVMFRNGVSFLTPNSANNAWHLNVLSMLDGKVGIGTDSPAYKLHVNGATYINGTFLQSALTSYQQQVITLSLNSTGWVKLFTMDSPGGCRVRYRAGSQNSEEIGEFNVKATYTASGTQLTWSRQTYYHNINEIRVTGSSAGPYTVWALVRTTDFAPNFWWQLLEANSYITLHNVVDTPAGSTISLSYPGYNSTNFNHDVAVTGKLNVKGTAGNADPFIRFEAVSPNNTFNWVSQAMASNLAGGNNLVHFIGQDPSTKNSGYIGYKHSSSSSDSNILTFGLYGVDNVLNINGAGKVGVNTQQPLHTLDVNGALGVNELYGRTSRDTGGGNIDLTEYNSSNFIILEVFGSINPNSGGSAYIDPIHMYVYVGRGWNGSNLTSYIYVQHVAPQARDIYPSGGGMGNAIDAVWFDGTTESDTVTAGTTSSYVRLKAYNYNSTYGSGFSVRVIRRA